MTTTLTDRLKAIVGVDTDVELDDPLRPTTVNFHRADRIAEPLVRDAIRRVRSEFPKEARAIETVFVNFVDGGDPRRRRVDV